MFVASVELVMAQNGRVILIAFLALFKKNAYVAMIPITSV